MCLLVSVNEGVAQLGRRCEQAFLTASFWGELFSRYALQLRPFEEAVCPYSVIEVDAIEIVISVEAHPQEYLCGFVVGVDCPGAPASWDALEKEETAVCLNQAFSPGFASF